MTALAAGKATLEWVPNTVSRSYGMDALAQIWEGGIVCLDSTGYAVPGSTSTTLIAVGVAQESKLAGAVDGADNILVHSGVFLLVADVAFTVTAIGSACYIVDDATVSLTATSRSLAGVVMQIDGSGNPYVAIGLQPPNEDAALSAFEATLASTASGSGASLVGISDTSGNITATTQEAANEEIVKKANAALCIPIDITVKLAAVTSSGVVVYRMVAPQNGTIAGMNAVVWDPVTTSAKLATFTPQISGTSTSGGAVACNSTGCATVGILTTGTVVSGTNSFTAGQVISVLATSVTAFVEGQIMLQLFLASA